jgi:hypothetical protein
VSAYDDLLTAMDTFNAAERAELAAETGLVWLGATGPAFLAGDIRIRALFKSLNGDTLWCDANLVVESAYLGHPAYDYYADQPGGSMEPGHDLWVCTPERGRHNAIIVPITETCFRLDLPEPMPYPADNWCRSWRTHPWQTDKSAIGLVIHGVPQ